MLEIVIDTTLVSQRLEVALGGDVFVLEVRWNEHLGRYVLDTYDAEGSPLLLGRAVEVDQDLYAGHRVTSPDLPADELRAFDSSGLGEACGEGDLGGRVRLIYVGT